MQGAVSSGAITPRTQANLHSRLAPHELISSCVLFFARPKAGLLALWLLASGSHETQKPHLLLNHP
jgi:hypothetical protein